MKRFIIIAALLFIGYSASAQFKVNAGYLNSKVTAKESGISASVSGNGFFAGVLYEMPVGGIGLKIEPGLNFDYIKFKAAGESSAVYYLRAPLHLNYSFEIADMATLFLGAGPSVIFGVGGDDEPFEDGGMKRFDLQLGALAGVRIAEHFEIRAGYDWGLLKAEDLDIKNHRNAVTVGVAYTF
ncbi:MAG: porin family protein [Bacteroidales bacterium]|nr:porin family protein [Bacteroidales bacterium]